MEAFTTAFGPALMDLAALASGNWDEAHRGAFIAAYREGLIENGCVPATIRELVQAVDCCRVHQAAAQAAAYAHLHPGLSVGLHVDLGEWIYRNDPWEPLYQSYRQMAQARLQPNSSGNWTRFAG